jgi:hypothetical protein
MQKQKQKWSHGSIFLLLSLSCEISTLTVEKEYYNIFFLIKIDVKNKSGANVINIYRHNFIA